VTHPGDRLRIGLLGVGAFGSWHLKVYHEVPDVEVVLLAARTADRVAALSGTYGIPYTLDYREVLARQDIDAVDVCVPSHLQAAVAIEALAAGKHVLVEKPMATSVADGARMIEAAAAAGRVLMVGHIERFNPSLRRAKALIARGRIGRPVKISARRNSRSNKAEWEWETVGILTHFTGHNIDVMRWLMADDVVRVHAESGSLVRGVPGQDDAVCMFLRFAGGGMGVLDDSWCLPPDFPTEENDTRIDILGTEGSLFINDLDQTLHLCERGKGWSFPGMLRWPGVREGDPGVESYALKDELEHFARSARGLAEPVITGEEALKTLRVIDAAHQSLMTGRPADVGTATTR